MSYPSGIIAVEASSLVAGTDTKGWPTRRVADLRKSISSTIGVISPLITRFRHFSLQCDWFYVGAPQIPLQTKCNSKATINHRSVNYRSGIIPPAMRSIAKLRIAAPVAIIALLATGVFGNGQRQDMHATIGPSVNDPRSCSIVPAQVGATLPEGGRIDGNVYINDYYGLRYEFPKGWFVDKERLDYVANQKKQHGSQPNPEEKQAYAIWLMTQCHHQLLEVSRDPEKHPWPGAVHIGSPSITLNINDRALWNDLKGSPESSNAATQPPDKSLEIIRGPADYVFDGQLFSRKDVKETLGSHPDSKTKPLTPAKVIYTSSVSGTRNDYVILFNIVAESPEQLEELFNTLSSLKFR
jgi:hypothetical protein